MYKNLIRPLLFCLAPEVIHDIAICFLGFLAKLPGALSIIRLIQGSKDLRLQRDVFGLTFSGPVGLAGGFDKNGEAFETFGALGFSFVEVGTVTPRPQPGNPKPRVFRLPKNRALINRMGFNNLGVESLVRNLSRSRRAGSEPGRVLVGGNIGKNKDTPNEDAVSDYERCFDRLFPYVDFFVVNISSPNTPGLRELQDRKPLEILLGRLEEMNRQRGIRKPILLKIAPDLELTQLDEVLDVISLTRIDGIVATNTTIGREGLSYSSEEIAAFGAGGLSGEPLKRRSTEVIRYIARKTQGRLPIIAVGGIMAAEDALEKFQAGATLVQLYTGFVYEGPKLIRDIEAAVLSAGQT